MDLLKPLVIHAVHTPHADLMARSYPTHPVALQGTHTRPLAHTDLMADPTDLMADPTDLARLARPKGRLQRPQPLTVRTDLWVQAERLFLTLPAVHLVTKKTAERRRRENAASGNS